MRSPRLALVSLIIVVTSGIGIFFLVNPLLAGPNTASLEISSARTNSEGGVTISVNYLGTNKFDVKLDTHSVELNYDLVQITYLRDAGGNISLPGTWTGGNGRHHLSGLLSFPPFDDQSSFELVFQGVSGVPERVLKW